MPATAAAAPKLVRKNNAPACELCREAPGSPISPHRFLIQEARALLTRLARVRQFSLIMPSVPAAALMPEPQNAMEQHILDRKRELHASVRAFIDWMHTPEGQAAAPDAAQHRFTLLRLRFNDTLSQFDIFSNVLCQRSEHETGTWLSGLDVVANDALSLPGYYRAAPVVCYLDRGHGAAIRRARTRLPGGEESPVSIIRVPRERMVGSGIASSLVHETGHAAAELLDLLPSLRPLLDAKQKGGGPDAVAWSFWSRWISEIVADFWSVVQLGVVSTLGLMGVVSLPRAFVFRIETQDPHPTPYTRVVLSAAIGEAIYPHPQWEQILALWRALYPIDQLSHAARQLFIALERSMPEFVRNLVTHKPAALKGQTIVSALDVAERQPEALARLYQQWREQPALMRNARPLMVFAVLGQARANGLLSPEAETALFGDALVYWALKNTLDISTMCSRQSAAKAS